MNYYEKGERGDLASLIPTASLDMMVCKIMSQIVHSRLYRDLTVHMDILYDKHTDSYTLIVETEIGDDKREIN